MTIYEQLRYLLNVQKFITLSQLAKLEIQVTMRRKDGHNCGGFLDLVSDVSEETVTHHGQSTKLVIEQILAEFKTRVDPEDFLQYLTGLNEEDEVYMINQSLNRLHLPKLNIFCD